MGRDDVAMEEYPQISEFTNDNDEIDENIATLVRNLPADKYQELAGAVNDVFENKRFNRAQRRRLARNWRKYGKGRKMKIRDLSIHKYGWTLRIYYAVTCYYTGEILKSLTDIGCPDTVLHRVQGNMEKCEMDTGFTYSNKEHRQSVIVIGMHSSPWEFLNSFEHELRHLVDDIALTLGLPMAGEEVAYLTGEINQALWEDVHQFTCCKCNGHGKR